MIKLIKLFRERIMFCILCFSWNLELKVKRTLTLVFCKCDKREFCEYLSTNEGVLNGKRVCIKIVRPTEILKNRLCKFSSSRSTLYIDFFIWDYGVFKYDYRHRESFLSNNTSLYDMIFVLVHKKLASASFQHII